MISSMLFKWIIKFIYSVQEEIPLQKLLEFLIVLKLQQVIRMSIIYLLKKWNDDRRSLIFRFN